MLHLYLPVDAAQATAIRNAIAEEHRVCLFGRVVNTALPAQCMFEWYVSDQLLMMPDYEVRRGLHSLSDAVSPQETYSRLERELRWHSAYLSCTPREKLDARKCGIVALG